jgi:hypothetical protein
MNRLCYALLTLLLVLAACGRDPGPDAETQAALLGTWQDVAMDETLQFMEDGRGVVGFVDIRYRWVSESEIEIDYNPKGASANLVRYQVELDGDTLRLTWQEGEASHIQTYQRVE